VGILAATFFSDLGHEMATAVLPLYLGSVGLGAGTLGLMEGGADLLLSLSKLGGGILGHRLSKKRGWTALGYLITALGTSAMGLAQSVGALLPLRAAAWVGRGYRGPLRDFLLSESVDAGHFGRVYGLERSMDMLGAVGGPLLAAGLVWGGVAFREVILWAVLPGFVSAASIFFLVKEPPEEAPRPQAGGPRNEKARLPKSFWLFVVGVLFFGLGDFSRTFLIFLVSTALGSPVGRSGGTFSIALLLYALHNLISAGAAYPWGTWGDRVSKIRLLVLGYAVGVGTNALLGVGGGSIGWLVLSILLSGITLASVEVLEKASAATLLPRELRSLGFGILAFANAIGDFASSLYVGTLLARGKPGWAFGIASGVGFLGVVWLLFFMGRFEKALTRPPPAS
jgi:MFS family permease